MRVYQESALNLEEDKPILTVNVILEDPHTGIKQFRYSREEDLLTSAVHLCLEAFL